MKIWRISVFWAQSYIFSVVMYWKLKVAFLDHLFILFRLAVSDFWNKLPLNRCGGLNEKLRVFCLIFFQFSFFSTNTVTETTLIFSSAYRGWQGLSIHIFIIFFILGLEYGKTNLMKYPNNFLRCTVASLALLVCDSIKNNIARVVFDTDHESEVRIRKSGKYLALSQKSWFSAAVNKHSTWKC